MTEDRPSVKFTIENSMDLTELDVETFLLSYKVNFSLFYFYILFFYLLRKQIDLLTSQ